MKTATRSSRRPRLSLQSLERRDTPAGSVTAAFSGGVLTLVGDVEANQVQISAVQHGPGADVIVTGLGDTSINGHTEFHGVRSIRANLKGGDDTLSADPTAPFVLGGLLSVDLGDGSNTLDLQPAGDLGLGGLNLKAKSGTDLVRIAGPDGGTDRITGNVDLSFGEGGSSTTLTGLDVLGHMNLAAGDGDDTLSMQKVHVGRPAGPVGAQTGSAAWTGGKGAFNIDIGDSALPATTVAAQGPVTLTATGSSFVSLSATSPADARVTFTDTFARRGVSVTAGPLATAGFSMSGDQATTGRVTVHGGQADLWVTDAPAAHLGGMEVIGKAWARFTTDGSAVQVDGPAVVRGATATLSAAGTQVTFKKDLSVIGSESTDVSFRTGPGSSIGGSLVVTGGKGDDSVRMDENMQVKGDVRMALGAGANTVDLGGASPGMAVGGKLAVTTTGGDDRISLSQVDVGGPTSILTGNGADALSIQGPSLFHGGLAVDQGAGADTMSLAMGPGGAMFNGLVSIRQGAGDDTMNVSPLDDASRAAFKVSGSRIDGGTGTDTLSQSLVDAGIGSNVRFLNYEIRG